ncbi:caspase-8 isoform X2 [Pempheris klunzingeri]|uniref:caspase-8 isoform X2 n=1 Tax=Pempheris klunzingeri TaxID=3127111 RepID=UPI003980073E
MEFQMLLLEVGKALRKDEVKALAFLCTDLLSRNPTSVESASDLFSRLEDQDHLLAERPHLLTELLLIIQRNRLVRDLELSDQGPSARSLISPYRKLLYDLSEDMTDDDLKNVKFLLDKHLPRRKLNENTTLEVFLEMEHMDLISETDLNLLESIMERVCPMLKEKIKQFKALHAQETGRPRSMTYPLEPQQVRGRTASQEMPDLQPLTESGMNYSNTSVDFPSVSHGGGECEALSNGLSGLSTETSTCITPKVTIDAKSLPQENKTSAEKQMPQTTDTNPEVLGKYPMTAAKRGICLIVNNNDFTKSKGHQNREGTMLDEESLRKVFEWLGFEIKIESDCTRKMMLSVLQELSKTDHSKMDCVVCCILSHGQEGSVYGVDGDTVDLKELMNLFNGLNCPSLAEKPKLFFIQACQGTSEQRPVYVEADCGAHGLVCSDAIQAKESIPSDADFLLGMATVPSFVSFRERTKGTWFIQSLCQNLVHMVPNGCDLVSILTKVNADVSQRTDIKGVKKQMPQPAFTLRKKVIFPIPQAPPPDLSRWRQQTTAC